MRAQLCICAFCISAFIRAVKSYLTCMRSQSGISGTGFQAVSGSQPARQTLQSRPKHTSLGHFANSILVYGESNLLEERADAFPINDETRTFPSNRLRKSCHCLACGVKVLTINWLQQQVYLGQSSTICFFTYQSGHISGVRVVAQVKKRCRLVQQSWNCVHNEFSRQTCGVDLIPSVFQSH